jgi:hypothetical protein
VDAGHVTLDHDNPTARALNGQPEVALGDILGFRFKPNCEIRKRSAMRSGSKGCQ